MPVNLEGRLLLEVRRRFPPPFTASAAETTGSWLAPLATTPEEMLKALQNQKVVRCDQPALTVLWLSLAAWNVPVGLGLAAVAAQAARKLLTPGAGRARA